MRESAEGELVNSVLLTKMSLLWLLSSRELMTVAGQKVTGEGGPRGQEWSEADSSREARQGLQGVLPGIWRHL